MIIEKLSKNKYVVSMYELSGEFDLAIEIESPNPSRFNKELKRVSDLIPTLKNYKMVLNIVTRIYPRNYLITNNMALLGLPLEVIIGGDRPIETFGKNEMKVMKVLLDNPKIRFTKLAKESKLNIKTSRSILKSLEERKIIRGYKYIVDTNKLNVQKFRLFLRLHNLGQEREKELLDYALKKKEIVQINKTVGDWNMEIDIEAFEKKTIRKITSEIREKFKDLIETFIIIEFYKYYKKSYLPSYLFE